MSLELANRCIQYPRGIAEDVLIKIDKFVLLIDFVIQDMRENSRILIILERPFLATARAMIDVFNKKITLRVRSKEVIFDVNQSIKKPRTEDDECYGIDNLDTVIQSTTQELLENDQLNENLEEGISQHDFEKYDYDSKTLIRRIEHINTPYLQGVQGHKGMQSEHLYSASAIEINKKKTRTQRHAFSLRIRVKTVNGEQQLQALVDGKKIVVTEASVRRDLQLDDEEGTDCLLNATIFEELTRMGYEKLSQKLTFYKAFFSPQWKFLIHTILQCLSAKTTAWNEFSSTMASAIICLATNQKFNFSKYIFESMVKNLDNAGKFLMYPRKRLFQKGNTLISNHMVQAQEEIDKAVNEEPSMQLKELMDFCTKLQQRVLDLENTKTAQSREITTLKKRVKKLEKKGGSRTHKLKRLYRVGRSARVVSSKEASLGDQKDASKQVRKIDDIDKDAEITLVDETQGRYGDEDMFGVNDLDGDEVVVESEVIDKAGEKRNIVEEAVDVTNVVTIPVSAATITNVELTLAQTLAGLKSARPKIKGVVMQEPSESTLTISLQLPSQVKGQGSKDKVEEANIAWDDIQVKIDADYQLVERLQAQEQQELTIKEKSTLFVQLLEKRRKHFAAKRAEEKRNIPPTRAQQRSIITELVEGSEVRAEGSETREESSSKRAGDELEQENAKKQKMDDDQEAAKMKELIKIIPDEEEVAVDAIPLATKPPSIVDWKIVKEGKIKASGLQ
ncbi:hypothetical protein Tco_0912060 [Tanacetum coccineum]